MSKETQSSNIIQANQRRRSRLFMVFVLVSLILGLTLLGCGSAPETEPPEVVVEDGSTETTEPAPPDTIVPTPEPFDCDPAQDKYELLPAIGDNAAEGITVEICIPGGANYIIETYEGESEDLNFTKIHESPFPVKALLTYFKIKDGDNVITTFDPKLLMRITYTSAAWNRALEYDEANELGRPKVAYLPWVDGEWADEWLELGVDVGNIHPPGENGPDGFLEIYIDELPDPLIGNC